MSLINGYVTLAQFKAAHNITSSDATDDGAIERIIQAASRWLDDNSGHSFYPRVETYYLDYPEGRGLMLPDDLLEIISLTNGDGTSITSTYYNLYPQHAYPKNEIRLKESSTVTWAVDGDSNTEGVIDLVGIFAYHNRYAQEGWKLGTTLNEATGITATELTFTLTSSAVFEAGQIIRIDNELLTIASISGNDITVIERGDNGSTAATHDNLDSVYYWRPMAGAYQACYELAVNMYHSRKGEDAQSVNLETMGGVIVSPREVPGRVWGFVKSLWGRV